MTPVIAIVGRPNVGKSTLFNRLTRSRNALVNNRPGVTRDRQYGLASYGGNSFILIDTGGLGDFEAGNRDIAALVEKQSLRAIEEADTVFWVVDARSGLTAADETLAAQLRPYTEKLMLVVNKTEGLDPAAACLDFHALGFGTPVPVSAEQGLGMDMLMDSVPVIEAGTEAPEAAEGLHISIVGRPNVGKSTLINRMLGEERMLTYDQPGTTRDAVHVPFQRDGKAFVLIDTAGIRRRARIDDALEKFSVIKSIKAIELAQIVIAVLDAREALTEQDMNILGIIADSGKPLLIAVNKWDGLDRDQKTAIKNQIDRKLQFIDYACIHFISALHGSGVGKLFDTINKMERSINTEVKSSKLTDMLAAAVAEHSPPMVRGRRIKLRYAHLGGHDPLRIIIHGNQTEQVPENYRRYLAGFFRRRLRLTGMPVLIEFKHGENPYQGRKNPLSKRQVQKRKRLIKHVKGKKRN